MCLNISQIDVLESALVKNHTNRLGDLSCLCFGYCRKEYEVEEIAGCPGQAVHETNSYRSALFVIGTAKSSRPVCLGTAGEPRWDVINQWTPEDPQWSPDSRYIYRTIESRRLLAGMAMGPRRRRPGANQQSKS